MKISMAAEKYAGMHRGSWTLVHALKGEAPFNLAAWTSLAGYHSRADLMAT